MDITTSRDLHNIAQGWGRGTFTLQDFIDAVLQKGYEFKDMHIAAGSDTLISFRLTPRGMFAPIYVIKTYKVEAV